MDSIFSSDTKQPPAYLQNSDIRLMFHWFLDRLDNIPAAQRTNRISRVISPKNFRRLFVPDEPDDDEVLWKLILRCQTDGLIRISSDKKRRDPVKNAGIRVNQHGTASELFFTKNAKPHCAGGSTDR
jgi:hypothetical protein